jgi:hypothetical protein
MAAIQLASKENDDMRTILMFGASTMALASVCSITAEGGEATGGSGGDTNVIDPSSDADVVNGDLDDAGDGDNGGDAGFGGDDGAAGNGEDDLEEVLDELDAENGDDASDADSDEGDDIDDGDDC